MSTTEALRRKEILDLAKKVGLVDWIDEDYTFFTYSDGCETASEKLIAFVDAALAAAAPSPVVAWQFKCARPGTRMEYATVDENDSNHWPLDQWTSVEKIPLCAAPRLNGLTASETAETASVAAKLKDPVAVHVALIRGEIAKPAIRDMLHAYGEEALAQYDRGAASVAGLDPRGNCVQCTVGKDGECVHCYAKQGQACQYGGEVPTEPSAMPTSEGFRDYAGAERFDVLRHKLATPPARDAGLSDEEIDALSCEWVYIRAGSESEQYAELRQLVRAALAAAQEKRNGEPT